ncbi:hypothetical protein [Hymenobacter rubripertinctus]|uniref:Uncharacterized protein n=1 Tax=Hymenobacter rubripertinctus TaxID=2029981 RepID=A0A418QRT1_9BACT|nr:hypothetical protein [Hymenobacter rubripertinctus]RIY07975.1 hypothetical protein D0T11_15510 [Hymenobacter rubripertinctus]
MSDLHNPLFEDEKEFLERQKLEYERALRGDVEQIKTKTLEVGKYAAIGASVLGGIWLVSKAFGGRSQKAKGLKEQSGRAQKRLTAGGRRLRPLPSTTVDTAVADDLGFGAGHQQTSRAPRPDAGPSNSFSGTPTPDEQPDTYAGNQYQTPSPEADHSSEASSIMASAFKAFMQSDTGKMLIAQASAVLIAYVAKKAGEYLPVLKNVDLATPGANHTEPETRDIDFTYHHDDADAPHQPA